MTAHSVGAQTIDAILSDAVQGGAVNGVVAIVAGSTGTLYQGAFGHKDSGRQSPMRYDTIFRLASMTKLVTGVAVMQLVDEGRLNLDDEVVKFVPEFGELDVLEGLDGDRPVLRRPSRAATVRELLAHTSGISYDVWNAEVLRYSQLTGVPGIASGLRSTLLTPLVADPATVVEYGTGFDWAGVVVEAIAGESLDDRYERLILGPLGMQDTCVSLDPSRAPRCAPVLARRDGGAGEFTETEIGYPAAPEFTTGGGCLYSTAEDFSRLQLALLGGGCHDGCRILSPESAAEMFAPQTGSLRIPVLRSSVPTLSCDVTLSAGDRWGIGMCINDDDIPGLRSRGSGGWAGIFNTYFWIDPTADIVAGLFMQYVPFYDETAAELLAGFEREVYRSVAPAGDSMRRAG
jgi:CubicO group peptidase (beta-lactamase class C family)